MSDETPLATTPVEPAAGPATEPGRVGRAVRRMLVPFLAVFTALVIGALVIILSDAALLGLWASDPLKRPTWQRCKPCQRGFTSP
jgi:hypothetical protein